MIKEKRFQKVGSGVFSIARKVLPRKGRTKGPIVGNVIKIIRGSTTLKSAQRTKKLIENYIKLLNQAKVNTTPTKIKIMFSKGRYPIILTQPPLPKEAILSNYLKNCSKNEAILALTQAIEMTKNVMEFNSKNQTKIGLDFRIENLAKTNNGLTFFDYYPPYFISKTISITPTDVIRKKRNILTRVKNKLLSTQARYKVLERTENRLDMQKQQKRIIMDFIKARPDLEEVFERML